VVLHKILVELGLTYASDKDAEMKLAHFISKKFQEAAALFVVRKFQEHNDTFWLFRQCLVEVWKPSTKRTKYFIVNDSFLESEFPDLCGPLHPVTIFAGGDESLLGYSSFDNDGHYAGLTLNTTKLENAQDVHSFKKELAQLIATIYHECDHVYSPAEQSGSETVEHKLLYFMDKAEIRAHGKELAFLYYHAFPGKKYNHKTFSRYVFEHYAPLDKPNQMLLFLEIFRDPEHFDSDLDSWKDYVHYAQTRIVPPGHKISVRKCKKTYRAYMHFIQYFVRYFNDNPTHRLKLDFDLK
tara:strand:+ start:203 stop:1090 length:888 start_codon:yes stop_codon:yes gene_type:complete